VLANTRIEDADFGHRQPEPLRDGGQDQLVRRQPALDDLFPERRGRRPDLGRTTSIAPSGKEPEPCNQPLVCERHELLTPN
jgi:hypothetical protein